jgi:hypothetical protein
MNLANLLCILLHTVPSTAAAVDTAAEPPRPSRVELFVGGGWLTSVDTNGVAAEGGVRVRLSDHFAATADMGYGVLRAPGQAQDRWWLVPSLELSAPLGALRFDLGGGVGVAICSGYPTLDAYFDRPFKPDWAFQLAPAARGYLRGSYERWFVRADAGTLLLQGNSLGFRDGNNAPTLQQTSWAMLWLGAKFDL